MNDNTKHCKMIADNLQAAYESRAYFTDDGDISYVSDCADVPDDCEECSLWDYLDEIYNIEYRLDSNKEYKSVALMVACGGPNIWVDTGNCEVELFWWGDHASWPISRDVADEIDSIYEDIFNC